MTQRPTVSCYYFPNYHVDVRNEAIHGPGWTEWELAKCARPRFTGHVQPLVPQSGYEDEANPSVMHRKIALAADHGIDTFIFDWYWYNDGPFLQRALDEGFLGADNNERMSFALMWANHDWQDIHPVGVGQLGAGPRILYPGSVNRDTFETVVDVVLERYFSHPSYWLIDGSPYFSIYDIAQFVRGLGGIAATRQALDFFRERVCSAGFPSLHLNAVIWSASLLPGERRLEDANELLGALGFDSATSYVWVHHDVLQAFPQTDYEQACERYLAYWSQVSEQLQLPYAPNVTMGWDPSPRTVCSDSYTPIGYPFTATLAGNSPDAFARALAKVKARLDEQQGAPIVTINAWNEWTEGSYLEPDTTNGTAYLEAILNEFGCRPCNEAQR